jgi:hypothetical protein
MRTGWTRLGLAGWLAASAAGCSGAGPGGADAVTGAPPTEDVATRQAPVVPGRPARVFVMAGFGKNCEPLGAPDIAITEPPEKGDVSFVAGQETTIQFAAGGTCAGKQAKGTGIYYTARAGTSGKDRFSVTAKLQSGETATRAFEVTIVE